MPTSIRVKLLGTFRRLADIDGLSLRVENPSVRDVIVALVDSIPEEARALLVDSELNDPRPNALILLNGREINVLKGLETNVSNGDEVTLLPVAHGG